MCQYRYYYFAACQHQHTVLFAFCDGAAAYKHIPPATRPPPSEAAVAVGEQRVAQGDSGTPFHPASLQYSPAPSSTSSTQHTAASSFSVGSSVPTSFASIPESALNTASHEQQSSFRHHSQAPPQDMATFSPLGLRHWITAGTIKPGPVTDTTNHEASGELIRGASKKAQSLSGKRDGLRNMTDESCDMPDSGEMLRHIAASCRGSLDPQRFDASHLRAASYMTELTEDSAHNGPESTLQDIAMLESGLAALQADVLKLRNQATLDASGKSKTEPIRSANAKPFVDVPLKEISIGCRQPEDSAAARLQKAHEMEQRAAEQPPPSQNLAEVSLPTSSDFPELSCFDRVPIIVDREASNHKPSYRDMATSTGTASISAAKRTKKLLAEVHGDADYVIISPCKPPAGSAMLEQYSNTESSSKATTKQSPRFAQPTKSFARRADETTRKDSTLSSPIETPEGSPKKSTRHSGSCQQKRKSLPAGWMANASQSPRSSTLPSCDDKTRGQGDSKCLPDRVVEKKSISYMSPTKATTHRNIATLGDEINKRVSPKVHQRLAKIDTTVAGTSVDLDTPNSLEIKSSSTAISDESFNIITDFPAPRNIYSGAVRDKDNTTTVGNATYEATIDVCRSSYEQDKSTQMQRRSTVGSPVAEYLASRAKVAGLPMVANTKPTRRVSHSHLLQPIATKLAKLGLLRTNGCSIQKGQHVNDPKPQFIARQPLSDDRQSVQGSSPPLGAASIPKAAMQTPKCVPPHRRRKGDSSCGESAVGQQATIEANRELVSAMPQSLALAVRASQTPPLNAAAKEFRPMSRPQTIDEQLRSGDLEAVTAYRSNDEWQGMSPQQRRVIAALRGHQFGSPREADLSCATSLTSPSQNTSNFSNQKYRSGVAAEHASSCHLPTGSEKAAFGSSILKPDVVPKTSMIQWQLRNADGREAQLRFGRAAPPSVCSPSSPTPARLTSVFSPQNTTGSWAIASAGPTTNGYGWLGGDGREVRFTSSGPDAERDPHSPVHFNFRSRTGSTDRGPRLVGPGEDDNSPPLAPRSRQQWAERLGYYKVPCGEVNITHAVEFPVAMNPVSNPLGPYCFAPACFAALG